MVTLRTPFALGCGKASKIVFWVRHMVLDRRNYWQVVETTVELAQKAGVSEIIRKIINKLKDEAKPYRKMVMETITVVGCIGH
jgi:splicing factor 3B subunit 1